MVKIILILLILTKINYSQEWINDSFTGFLENIHISNITNSNDTLWMLNYDEVIRYTGEHFDTYWFDGYSKGHLSNFTDSNSSDIWENINSNNKAVCIYTHDTANLTFLIILNNFVHNIKVARTKVSYADDICLDEYNNIWFIGYFKNDTKPTVCYIIDDSVYYLSINLPDSLMDYRIDKLFLIESNKYIVLSKFNENNIMSSFVLKLDFQNNYTFFRFPDHKRSKRGYIVYNYYFNNDKLYLLNNYNDLIVIDENTKTLVLNEDNIGECFSLVVINSSIYYAYTSTHTEINLTEFSLNTLSKSNYVLSDVYTLGIKSLLLYKEYIIALTGSCSNDFVGKLFKFKPK